MLPKVLIIVLLLCCHKVITQSVDQTIVSMAKGPEVVQAVVDKIKDNCIYPNDRLFLRRLAFVESSDGLDSNTFKNGYYGGIWQVNKDKYEATKHCNISQYIANLCEMIKSNFGIDWSRTRWQDLTKPLYSGLAASLYLNLRTGNNTPGDIAGQARFWSYYYHLGQPKSDYLLKLNLLQRDNCEQNEMDIVFVVDSSGSIGIDNFLLMLNFLQNVTDQLDVAADSVHVGMVSFESTARVEFYLNRFQNLYEVKQAISNVNYLSGGTDIASGINAARKNVFNENNGARKNAVKVIILLTDGQSNYDRTLYEASFAHNEGIDIFVIGVGSVNLGEINAAASDPDCTHVFLLSSFNEMDSLLYQIQKSACRAILKIPNSENSKNDTGVGKNTTYPQTPSVGGKLSENITKTISVAYTPPSTSNGTGIVTKVICGIVQVYTSYNTPHPGPAVHDKYSVATDGHPSVLYVNSSRDGKPLYIAYVGTKLPATSSDIQKCNDSSFNVTFIDKGRQIICKDEYGVVTECTKTDFLLNTKFKQWMCSDHTLTSVQNPCKPTSISPNKFCHPYPHDSTKFICCDLKGNMYITLCPPRMYYNQEAQTCGEQEVQTGNGKIPLDPSLQNPCTATAILSGKMFFEYPKQSHLFIHCDLWGQAFVNQCRSGEIWQQASETCFPDTLNQGGNTHSTSNPCSKDAKVEKFFPLPNQTLFIHCDLAGNPWVQSCGFRQVFDIRSSTCVYNQASVIG